MLRRSYLYKEKTFIKLTVFKAQIQDHVVPLVWPLTRVAMVGYEVWAHGDPGHKEISRNQSGF